MFSHSILKNFLWPKIGRKKSDDDGNDCLPNANVKHSTYFVLFKPVSILWVGTTVIVILEIKLIEFFEVPN